jgi:ABC-type transport system involved in cytochrome c biogenesis permease component
VQGVRWLFLKDVRILKRSPLMVCVLVLYPILVALLIGFALSRGPDKPTIAVLNQVPPGEKLTIGNEQLGRVLGADELAKRTRTIDVATRAEAERKVRDGDALAALIVPPDAIRKASSQVDRARVDVIVSGEDPVKERFVDDAIASVIANENRRISHALIKTNLEYLRLLLRGGTVNVLGNEFSVLGLRRIGEITKAARRALPRGSPVRTRLDQVIEFNRLAQRNFGIGGRALAAASEPIVTRRQVLSGGRVPLTSFAAAVAVAVSLMFVTVLLASGSLALERTENVFTRLVRGPVSRSALLGEKVLLASGLALVVTLLMVLVVATFVPVEWDRFPLWLLALALGGAAFGALGVAIGALAREVSMASLIVFALLLPVVFVALVPSGVVSAWLYDLTRVISALFPFKSALRALDSALYGEGAIAGPLLHLAALAGGFGLVSRLLVGRLA